MRASFLTRGFVRAAGKIQHYHTALGIRGVLLFSWAKLSGRKPVYRVTLPGIRNPVVLRIGTTDVSVMRQVLQECQYDAEFPFVPRRIVDAGANIGLAAVYFANKYPNSEILAVEPELSNFQLLKENTRSYPNVHAIRGALWKEDGELILFDPDMGHHGFQTHDIDGRAVVGQVRVKAFTVPSLMRHMNWSQVDLLKVDIEGAEKEVFESSEGWIRCVEACMVELHDSIKPGCAKAFDRATADFAGRGTKGEAWIAWRCDE
jgi:FkbM family methyltransferase